MRRPRLEDAVFALWAVRARTIAARQLRRGGLGALSLPPPPPGISKGVGVVRRVLVLTRGSCLVRAVVRQACLAADGKHADVVIGMTSPTDGFRAHAWLDGDRDHAGFHELHRYAGST